MNPVDLPAQDREIQMLPADVVEDVRQQALNDLFFFNKAILSYKDLTVGCHGPMCVFLTDNPKRFKLVLYPRDHFKTTCGTIGGNMQKACKNPNERILIANESATNSERMLRAIRQHAESNRIFRTVFSDVIPKDTRKVRWNDSELDFVRDGIWPEPTFDTIGMTGAVTSRHYSHICFDDPISEEAVKSEKVMQDVLSRMSAVMALLTNPNEDSVWLIGTRWAIHDIYSQRIRVMGDKMAVCIRAAIEEGDSIFPERFSLDTLALMRQDMQEYKFSCLMMNRPRNEELQDLNVKDMRYWAWAEGTEATLIMYDALGQEHRRVPLSALDITTTVDLAPAETMSSDRNAVVTTGVTPWGEVVVLDAWGRRCNPLELIEYLFQVKQRFQPRTFGIEGVAYQKAFKYFLRSEASRRGTYFNITEIKATGKKEIRVRGLQPVMAVGRMYCNASQALLLNEMADFPLGEHDDVVDALSMHLQLWRGVMSPEAREASAKARDAMLHRI